MKLSLFCRKGQTDPLYTFTKKGEEHVLKKLLSLLQCFNVAMLQCSNVAMLQCCNVAMLQCCNVAMLQCCNVAMKSLNCQNDVFIIILKAQAVYLH
jgi:hypothetical protein